MGKEVISDNCVFCDSESEFENELCFARPDKYPVNPGHFLIIPKRHCLDWFDMTQKEQLAAFDLVELVKAFLSKKHQAQAFNIGMNCGEIAGQTIMHAHIHLIPRYNNDMEEPAGGVRGVIPSKQKY